MEQNAPHPLILHPIGGYAMPDTEESKKEEAKAAACSEQSTLQLLT